MPTCTCRRRRARTSSTPHPPCTGRRPFLPLGLPKRPLSPFHPRAPPAAHLPFALLRHKGGEHRLFFGKNIRFSPSLRLILRVVSLFFTKLGRPPAPLFSKFLFFSLFLGKSHIFYPIALYFSLILLLFSLFVKKQNSLRVSLAACIIILNYFLYLKGGEAHEKSNQVRQAF